MTGTTEAEASPRWHVPEIKGVWFLVYRLVWLTLFAASLASLTYFDPRNEARLVRLINAGNDLGFGVWPGQSAIGIMGAPLGDEGHALGFRESDLVVAVDGRPAPTDYDAQTALLAGPPGSHVTLAVQHADGTAETLRIDRDPARTTRAFAGYGLTAVGRRTIIFTLTTLATIASLIAAALLFVRRPRNPVAQLLSFSLVLGHAAPLGHVPGMPAVLVVNEPLIASTLLSLAILLFPHQRFATRWHGIAFLAVILVGVIQVLQWLTSTWSYWASLPLLFQAMVLLVAVGRQLRLAPPGIERQQTKFVLFGIAAYALLYGFGNLLLPVEALPLSAGAAGWVTLWKRVAWALADIAIPAGLLVSVLRYRLYDAETAISRSVAYGALTVLLIAVFAGSEKVVEILGEQYFGGRPGGLASALAAAVAAATIAPLHHRVTRWAERRFQGDLVHLRQGLPLLVGDLRETAAPATLADAVLRRVEAGARARHGAVVLGHDVVAARNIDAAVVRGWLAAHPPGLSDPAQPVADRGDPTFVLRVPLVADGVDETGWLLLGPRPDGSFYGKDEREALGVIADPVARALAIATNRQRRAASQEQREAGLHRTVDALRRFIHDRFGVDVGTGSAATVSPDGPASGGGRPPAMAAAGG